MTIFPAGTPMSCPVATPRRMCGSARPRPCSQATRCKPLRSSCSRPRTCPSPPPRRPRCAASSPLPPTPAATQAALCRLRARAAGSTGMAGGQAIDLASVGLRLTEGQLRQMHRLKTGALLQASVLMGAVCGQAAPAAYRALSDYGAALGLAFQVVYDILDVVADSATLGKTAGKDAIAAKPTYVSLLGLERAQAQA